MGPGRTRSGPILLTARRERSIVLGPAGPPADPRDALIRRHAGRTMTA